jgi:hypothetical protein
MSSFDVGAIMQMVIELIPVILVISMLGIVKKLKF